MNVIKKNKNKVDNYRLKKSTIAKSLDIFWADGYYAKTKKDKNFKFSAFYRNIYRLNVYVNRIFVKNIVQPVGRPKK